MEVSPIICAAQAPGKLESPPQQKRTKVGIERPEFLAPNLQMGIMPALPVPGYHVSQ